MEESLYSISQTSRSHKGMKVIVLYYTLANVVVFHVRTDRLVLEGSDIVVGIFWVVLTRRI